MTTVQANAYLLAFIKHLRKTVAEEPRKAA
jgi:hypothetical protein